MRSLKQRLVVLCVAAILSEILYFGYFVRTFPLLQYYAVDIDMGAITQHSVRGFWSFIGAFAALFFLAAVAWWCVRDFESSALLWVVLGCGGAFAITMCFVYPVTAIDIYTYVDQSRIMVHYHQNPVFVPPSSFPGDPLMALSDGWRTSGAPYGPIGIVVDAIPTVIFGSNLLWNLLCLKALFSLVSLANAFLVYRLVRRVSPRSALAGAVLVAWNPLVIFEISANGHNDAVMMLFALLAFLSLADGELFAGLVLISLSALVKFATLLLLPLAVAYALSRCKDWIARVRLLVLAGAASIAMAAAAYAPFWRGVSTFQRALLENQLRIESFSSVVLDLFPSGVSADRATLAGRILFVPLYLYALYLATRGFEELLRACTLALVGFLALAITNFKVWYAVWIAIVGATCRDIWVRIASLLCGLGATLSASYYGYLWVWNGLFEPSSFRLVNNLAYASAFIPAAVCLFLSYGRSPTRPADSGGELQQMDA